MSILSLPNLQIWKGWFSLLGRAEAAVFGSWGSRVGLPEGCSGGASVLLCLSACSWARCQATTKTPAGASARVLPRPSYVILVLATHLSPSEASLDAHQRYLTCFRHQSGSF